MNPRSVIAGFVTDKVALVQILSPVSVIPPVLHTPTAFVYPRRNTNVAIDSVLRFNAAWVGITQYSDKATSRSVRASNTSEGKTFFFFSPELLFRL